MAGASAGSAMRSMAKGVKSVINIYNVDLYNPASVQGVLKTVTLMNNDISHVETEMNDMMGAVDCRRDSVLHTQHQRFISATTIIRESLKQLGNILRLTGTLQQPSKETKECVDSLVDGVRTQFNVGFDQAKDSFDALRHRVEATSSLRDSPLIQRIMTETGMNIAGATNHDGAMADRLNCLNNVVEGQRSLNAAAAEVCNDLNRPQEEQEEIQEVRHEINVGTKMWDMVFYFGQVVAFFITLGVSVSQSN
ncbi:uncharacterized protein [Ptychodera flava]|uniref:uncharacterized protein n=1 Tax=Ptychodera flava TaxID=63121 RepID=UPI00396A00A9